MSWLLRRIWSGYTAAHDPAAGGAPTSALLLEDYGTPLGLLLLITTTISGDNLLLETGDAILLE